MSQTLCVGGHDSVVMPRRPDTSTYREHHSIRIRGSLLQAVDELVERNPRLGTRIDFIAEAVRQRLKEEEELEYQRRVFSD